jgi:hypothetical protein
MQKDSHQINHSIIRGDVVMKRSWCGRHLAWCVLLICICVGMLKLMDRKIVKSIQNGPHRRPTLIIVSELGIQDANVHTHSLRCLRRL